LFEVLKQFYEPEGYDHVLRDLLAEYRAYVAAERRRIRLKLKARVTGTEGS
jgi:Cys-tRNA synthase (O-phospho-L-seryl-tRNA:Cys-tRNA synthase)